MPWKGVDVMRQQTELELEEGEPASSDMQTTNSCRHDEYTNLPIVQEWFEWGLPAPGLAAYLRNIWTEKTPSKPNQSQREAGATNGWQILPLGKQASPGRAKEEEKVQGGASPFGGPPKSKEKGIDPDMGVTQSLGLPHGQGSHPVGCTDVMVGQSPKGLFFRLFYPCIPQDGAEQPAWIPRYEYYCGLADYMNMNRKWCAPLLSVTFGAIRDRSASATYFCKLEPEAPDLPGSQVHEEWLSYRGVPKDQKEFHFRNPQDNMDLTKVTVMGHSFGGATAVLALVKEAQFKCAVALDAWMFPLENSLYPKVTKPVLFINTESFQTAESVAKMKKISAINSETKIITILGTVHQSQTDFTFLAGNLVNRVFQTRGTIDPYEGLNITNQAALAFLQKHLQLKEDFDKWDNLLEGIGDCIVPDSPLQKSSL
ncbi:hypothetical protein JD844_005419 [Phrynosoma platyrhinos]|uniref:1-alkyl-2-acetylglycerophosphocholine esterase n=1 Tax=Phrynosoma platyrhinos TaxID=52577 RepID=A0ABQ7TP09_PHRPL|nr:hypothetical protein JD844_005419 [Phrynosoma platyrhinos]